MNAPQPAQEQAPGLQVSAVPTQWGMGSPSPGIVMLQFQTPQGINAFFITADDALRMAEGLRVTASGLQVASSLVMP